MRLCCLIISILITSYGASAQAVPAKDENIPHLVTFGGKSDKSWGDDDFYQSFFFVPPKTHSTPVYIRVFDPETSGTLDELKGVYDTEVKFSIYGGKTCITEKAARKPDPVGNYRSGVLLAEKKFGSTTTYDGKWYTFGPFNPTAGELTTKYGGYVFKMIAQGTKGNDGNLYNYFLSTRPKENIAVEGGNAFTYEYTFRLHNKGTEVSHIYPYIDDKVISIKQRNFDWDNDGIMKFISRVRQAVYLKKSPDNKWISSEHKILDGEKNASLDIQFHKNKAKPTKNNNVVFYVTNQYGENLPFFTVPIGGIPKPPAKIMAFPKRK